MAISLGFRRILLKKRYIKSYKYIYIRVVTYNILYNRQLRVPTLKVKSYI